MNARSRFMIAASAGLSVAALSAATSSQAEGGGADPKPPPSVRRIDASPIARYVGDKTIVVDASGGFGAVHQLLKGQDKALDGWTIRVTGIPRATRSQIRRDDQRLMRNDPKVSASQCPSKPDSPRLAHGRTSAYLGCNETTGHERHSAVIVGPVDAGLKEAVGKVLNNAFPHSDHWAEVVVSVDRDGNASVSLPVEFGEAMRTKLPSEKYAMYRDLLFTAYSNADLTSVSYTIDGDCLAYAFAVGGDMCATSDLTTIGE